MPIAEENDMICSNGFRRRLAANLDGFALAARRRTDARRAAVAVTVVAAGYGAEIDGLPGHAHWSDAAALVLTRRAAGLRNHAGQWAFPGGRREAGEGPEETALRELAEEVGLHLGAERVMGRLDEFITRSGFAITPVVIWGGCRADLKPDPSEVASVHRVPVAELLREDAPILAAIPESRHPVLLMPVGSSWIAAPTAAMLYQFREVAVMGRETRGAHFEQPYFAWH